MRKTLKFPDDVREFAQRRYHAQCRHWLAMNADQQWSLEITLGQPTEQDAQQQQEMIRSWIHAWQNWQGCGEIIWCERRWRTIGIQRLPEKIVFSNPESVAFLVGELQPWQKANERFNQLIVRWPVLTTYLSRYFDMLASYSEADFQRLINLLNWLVTHPQSQLYPRQIPLAGIDTKWLEARKGMVASLLSALTGKSIDNQNFFQSCGLKALPQLIRLRILDPLLRSRVGGLSDIAISADELAALNLDVARVFIVENLQTGLAFTDIPNSIVLMSLGYHVDILSRLPWLAKADCIYWGDIDTHGFAILNRARSYLPHLRSILMDEATLLCYQLFWANENEQCTAQHLDLLTAEEQSIYQGLKQQKWGRNIRLEQERIAWDDAVVVLQDTLT